MSNIRTSTAGAPPPTYNAHLEGNELVNFTQVTDEDVALLISKSPSKQSQLDPIPTWLLKKCATKLVPFLTVMMNESLQSGCVPDGMKSAIVTPIIKNQI